jgi:hypothetical protein
LRAGDVEAASRAVRNLESVMRDKILRREHYPELFDRMRTRFCLGDPCARGWPVRYKYSRATFKVSLVPIILAVSLGLRRIPNGRLQANWLLSYVFLADSHFRFLGCAG